MMQTTHQIQCGSCHKQSTVQTVPGHSQFVCPSCSTVNDVHLPISPTPSLGGQRSTPLVPASQSTNVAGAGAVHALCGNCRELVLVDGSLARFVCPRCHRENSFSVGSSPPPAAPAVAAPVASLPGVAAVDPSRFPSYWKARSEADRKFEHETDEVKRAVQAMFDKTWKDAVTRDRGKGAKLCKFEVLVVQRNENPKLWAMYDRSRQNLARELGSGCQRWTTKTQDAAGMSPELAALFRRGALMPEINEFYLFHGSKPSAVKSICDSDFVLNLAGKNAGSLYGPGIYFAEASSKADEYATDDQEGIYQGMFAMLIARVACGNIRYCDAVVPPVQDLVDSVAKARTHHSVLGDREKCRGTYREFVVFGTHQAYPEYVAIYKRVEEAAPSF